MPDIQESLLRPSYLPPSITPPPSLMHEGKFWDAHPSFKLTEESAQALVEARALLEQLLRDHKLLRENGMLINPKGIDALKGHSTRDAVLGLFLNDHLKRQGSDFTVHIGTLAKATMLHDIGKLAPEIYPIVMSDQKLNPHDTKTWNIVKRHPAIGANLILSIRSIPIGERLSVATAVRYHHERYDGKGYYGANSSEIPHESAIITVVDAFDAMTGISRTYHNALPTSEAKARISEGSGSQFFPLCAKALRAIAPENDDYFVHRRTWA